MNNNYNSNTVVKQDFAVVKQVAGRATQMTDTTRHQSWQSTSPPLPDHAGSIPGEKHRETSNVSLGNIVAKTLFPTNVSPCFPEWANTRKP